MKNALKLAALIAVAAIGALVLRGLYIAASRPGAGAAAATVRIRVAADDLPAGLLLRDSDLAWKTVPKDQAPAPASATMASADTTTAGAATDLKGDLLRHAVHAGTPIGPMDVIEPSAPGFLAAALKPGMRAISVSVDDVSGNAGLIQPGDYVDVLLTQQLRADNTTNLPPTREAESETVAERVRVLAVGSAFQRPKETDTPASEVKPALRTNARTATFEVTPVGAQAITVAAHLGSLSLALRSFATSERHTADAEDISQPRTPPIWAGDVSRALRFIAATQSSSQSPQAPHHVIVYRGSTTDNASSAPDTAGSTGTPGEPPLPPSMPDKAPVASAPAKAPVAAGS